MPRSRRAKSQSVSSASGAAEVPSTPNGVMAPPSPPVVETPKSTRSRKGTSTSMTNTPRDALATTTTTTTPRRMMEAPVAPVGIPSIPPPHQPGVAQFVLVAGLSALLEAFLQSIASQFGTKELAAVSKHSESWAEVVGLLGWRVFTIGVYWFGRYDAYDVASLTLLLKTPTLLLLSFFYLLRPLPLLLTTLSTLVSTTIPFLFFRPLSPTHAPRAHPHAPRSLLRNRSILTDPYTTVSTTILSTAIFTVVLELAFQTFLPVHLVTTFDNIQSLEFIHLGPQGLPILLLVLLPAGFACTAFLFTPSTGATDVTTVAGGNPYAFDSTTAGLGQHVYHNAWGWYNPRQKTLIGRSAVLGALVVTETVVECAVGLEGVELVGALGYAGVWGVAVAVTGSVLDWVGGPSD